jgi:hypothetical protein
VALEHLVDQPVGDLPLRRQDQRIARDVGQLELAATASGWSCGAISTCSKR